MRLRILLFLQVAWVSVQSMVVGYKREPSRSCISSFMVKAQKPYSITPINFPVTGSESPKPVHTPGGEPDSTWMGGISLRVCEHNCSKNHLHNNTSTSTPMLITNSDTSLFFGLPLPLSQSPRVVGSLLPTNTCKSFILSSHN